MKTLVRAVAVAAVALLISLGFTSTAGAQTAPAPEYPPVSCTVQVTVTPTTVTVIVTCTGFTPGITITVTIEGVGVLSGTVGDDGAAVLSDTVSRADACGTRAYSATDGATTVDGTVDIPCEGTVTPAPVQTSGTLPYTGSDSSLPLAQLGIGLLAVGAFATILVRRRHAGASIPVDRQ